MAIPDAETMPPSLVKLFYRTNAFHSPADFSHSITLPAALEAASLDLYIWPTTTLTEIASLFSSSVRDVLPSPCSGTRLGFRLVFQDQGDSGGDGGRPLWIAKEMGSVVIGEDLDESILNGDGEHLVEQAAVDPAGDGTKTLATSKFVVGDYICCAIFPPLADAAVAPPPPAPVPPPASRGSVPMGGRGGAGPRRGGYGNVYAGGHDGNFRGDFSRHGGRGDFGATSLPSGDWNRGERLPEAPGGGGRWRERGRGRPY